jgi:hypothetical protein
MLKTQNTPESSPKPFTREARSSLRLPTVQPESVTRSFIELWSADLNLQGVTLTIGSGVAGFVGAL